MTSIDTVMSSTKPSFYRKSVVNPDLYVPFAKNSVVIGLGYKARHGKDTVAAEIQAKYGDQYDIRVYGFADALKRDVTGREEELAAKYNVRLDPNPDMSDPLCPNGKQPVLLQVHGEAMRHEDAWYWLRKTARKIVADKPQVALIKDTRHIVETYWVKASQGFLVNVSRNGYVDRTRDPYHVTETALDHFSGWDYRIVVEDGQLDLLKQHAIEVFDDIVARTTPTEFTTNDFTEEHLAA